MAVTPERRNVIEMPAHVRDQMMRDLRRHGLTSAQIARRVGLTARGVRAALHRLDAGGGSRPGRVRGQ